MGEWQQNPIKSTHHKEGKSFFFVISRAINGHLHQQSFAFHHSTSNKGLHRHPRGFDILENPGPFGFHKMYNICKFQLPFKAFQKIIMQGLKQTFKFTYHLQM